MKMRRTVSLLLSIVVVIMLAIPITANAATSNAPNRVINLVYDDSGSMINTNNQNVDTWCQAKYAIEVFAALMGEKDTLNIYVMSNYAKPRLVLKGGDGPSANVSKVHDMITTANNTPFGSVKQAYSDLTKVNADEKWLVVLTDGEFQGIDNIDAYFSQKASNINVMFLGMGPQADGITPNESNNIYYKEAKTNSEILKQVTDISKRIFNSNRLEVNVSSKAFSFDVPMGELVVFAQGANVKINGIKNADGKVFQSSTQPVTVKYSEKPATNYSDFIVAKDLVGSVATFKDDFVSGDYTVDVSGAETIEIYYKPNVEIAAYLKDTSGNEVTDLTDLEAGEYTIEFGFVKGGTAEKVSQSKLLGKVLYEAKVTNNGKTHEQTYASGDKIKLDEGSLSISVTARYLDYNTVSTQLDYTIFKNKGITFEVVNGPDYVIKSGGFEKSEPIVIKANIDGKEFTKEQWDAIGTPTVKLAEKQDFKMGDFKVEKTDEPGIYHVYPTLKGGTPSSGTYQDCDLTVEYNEKQGNETWSGKNNIPIKMQDERSWIERNRDLFIKLLILGIILFLVIGYLPFVKHYLPKSLKKKPYVKCVPEELGAERKHRNGSTEKSLVSTLIPYIPQTGKIKYVPKGVTGAPALEVKGIKNRRMSITNIKTFAGKEYITFDGTAIKSDCTKFETSAGVSIRVQKNGWTYHCTPNQER